MRISFCGVTSVKSVSIDYLLGKAFFPGIKVVENVWDGWLLGVKVCLVL